MLCVLIVEGMSVVVNVMLSLMSVMSPPPALCNLSVCTAVMLCQKMCRQMEECGLMTRKKEEEDN